MEPFLAKKRLQAGVKPSVAIDLLCAWPVSSNESNPSLKRLFGGDDAGKRVSSPLLYSLTEPPAQLRAEG